MHHLVAISYPCMCFYSPQCRRGERADEREARVMDWEKPGASVQATPGRPSWFGDVAVPPTRTPTRTPSLPLPLPSGLLPRGLARPSSSR